METNEKEKEVNEVDKETKAFIENAMVEMKSELSKEQTNLWSNRNILPDKLEWKREFGEQLKKLFVGEIRNLYFPGVIGPGADSKAIDTGAASGGAIIPETWVEHLYALIPTYGAAFKGGLQTLPLAHVLHTSRLSTDITMVVQGAENQASGSGSPEFSGTEVGQKTLVGYTQLSDQLVRKSPISVVDIFTDRYAHRYARWVDDNVFGLSGSAEDFEGIINTAGISTTTFSSSHTSWEDVSREYLIDCMFDVPAAYQDGSAWFMSSWALGQIFANVVSTAGIPLIDFDRKILMGKPVYETSSLPATDGAGEIFAVYGNLRQGVAFASENLRIDTSSHYGFTSLSTYVRAVSDACLIVALPGIFSVMATHA